MSGRELDQHSRREALAEALADLMLSEGLDLSLRDLADRLGTSGRMLLYYFETRDALITAALEQVSARLSLLLGRRGTGPRLPPADFLDQVLQQAADPEVAPFMRLWTEVVARAARGEVPYGDLAPSIVAGWMGWIDSRLEPARGEEAGRPAALLAIVEGLILLEQAAPGSTEGARRFLAARLANAG